MTCRQLAVALLFGVLLACGCFRQIKESGAEDSASFLVFQGDGAPVSVFVDDAAVADDLELVPDDGIRFRVAPGTHTVRVVRDDQVVVERKVYVGDGETRIMAVRGTG